ncbi:hypothetical protein DY000_02050834 [Brassica cretica]|uniref:Uncharacterized protein n=1 Tax=Brassica cretica TaxID=69181 RepID=A0ABQ7F3M7_BRACR|nr:hypothetical protein DY000_02050834 [Brassica cretica]
MGMQSHRSLGRILLIDFYYLESDVASEDADVFNEEESQESLGLVQKIDAMNHLNPIAMRSVTKELRSDQTRWCAGAEKTKRFDRSGDEVIDRRVHL